MNVNLTYPPRQLRHAMINNNNNNNNSIVFIFDMKISVPKQ